MEKETILEFYSQWQNRLPSLIDGYIYDENKRLLPTRYIFYYFKKILEDFLANRLEEEQKIFILPGIRGAGKTTLLMQILKAEKLLRQKDYSLLKQLPLLEDRFYVDISRLKASEISLHDFFNVYEEIKDFQFENLAKKHLILLDEVHYDEEWGLFLKNIFDRTKGHKNLLIIATGSSALHLKMNPDLSRRVKTIEIYPMKFSEYLILSQSKYPQPNLSDELQSIIFGSPNAGEAYNMLSGKELIVDRFFANLPLGIQERFFETGNFPFTAKIANKVRAFELIKNVVNSIIVKDVIPLRRFETPTINKISSLLYLLANSDVISYEKLQSTLRIPEFKTLDALIEVLVISGILIRVTSYGKTYGSKRKTPKLLFIAPSLRAAIADGQFLTGVVGKKLEDYFALIYTKDLRSRLATDLSYDTAEGGADFILDLNDKSKIVVEVGFNKESTEQVVSTQKKVQGKYGIVFGSKRLEIVQDSVLKIPLKFLLLI